MVVERAVNLLSVDTRHVVGAQAVKIRAHRRRPAVRKGSCRMKGWHDRLSAEPQDVTRGPQSLQSGPPWRPAERRQSDICWVTIHKLATVAGEAPRNLLRCHIGPPYIDADTADLGRPFLLRGSGQLTNTLQREDSFRCVPRIEQRQHPFSDERNFSSPLQ